MAPFYNTIRRRGAFPVVAAFMVEYPHSARSVTGVLIEKFEDLVFWQRARELAAIVLGATREIPLKKQYELAVQLERYAMAIMSDIAEGASCDQREDLVSFLYSAIGACTGLQSSLYLALDLKSISQSQFSDLYNRAGEIVHLIDSYATRVQEGRRTSPRRHRPS